MSEPGVPPTYTPPPPPPPPAGPTGSSVSPNRSLMVVLAYLWILCIIPLVAEKDDAEVQWHAKNGLALTLAEILLHAGLWVLQMVLSRVASGIGCVLGLVGAFLWLGGLVLRILCIMKAVNGQRFVIPVVSDYVNRF